MEHGLHRKRARQDGRFSFQRNSGHDSRAAFQAAGQIADKHGAASRGAILLTLTIEPLQRASRTRPAPPSADYGD